MRLRLDRTIVALALITLCSPANNPVFAQQPSQQQIDAIRSNCRSDFLSNCSGVPRGGPEAVRCLKDHLAQLSPGCHAAVSAITPAPAPKVAAPAPAAPAAEPVAPPAPASATATPTPPAPATPPAAQPSTASAPTPPATSKKVPPAPQPNRPAAATAPAAPPAAQPMSLLPLPRLAPRVRLMIVRACAAERRALCANVPPGGGGIVECLAERGEALSPRCRDAILPAK